VAFLLLASASVVTTTKRRNKGDYFKTPRAKASKCRHLARPAADEVCLLCLGDEARQAQRTQLGQTAMSEPKLTLLTATQSLTASLWFVRAVRPMGRSAPLQVLPLPGSARASDYPNGRRRRGCELLRRSQGVGCPTWFPVYQCIKPKFYRHAAGCFAAVYALADITLGQNIAESNP
jgi:hypothetical protein